MQRQGGFDMGVRDERLDDETVRKYLRRNDACSTTLGPLLVKAKAVDQEFIEDHLWRERREEREEEKHKRQTRRKKKTKQRAASGDAINGTQ